MHINSPKSTLRFGSIPLREGTTSESMYLLKAFSENKQAGVVHLVNTYTCTIFDAQRDGNPLLADNSVNLIDGYWLRRYLEFRFKRTIMGTRGPDVFERAFQPDLPLGERHYLLGSTPENLERLERNLSSLSKESATIGVYSPPFKELSAGEIQEIGLAVRGFRPDIVWVGLGTPKQDYFAQALSQHISVPIVCVGAAFDFLSGSKKTAPRWMQTYGLEWLFRLLTEPKRLWKRYLIGNIKFIFMAIRDKSSK